MEKFLLIIGGESTALEIRETVDITPHNYDKVFNVVANAEKCSYSFIEDKDLEEILRGNNEIFYILGFTNTKLKEKYQVLLSKYNAQLVNVIHPTAFISPSVKLGVGNFIAPHSVISSEVTIGNSNIINLEVSIGHNCTIGDNNVFNPGARISGCVTIGNECLFGSNCFLHQGISIVSNCKIDALTYIKGDIEVPSICSNYVKPKIFKNIFFK